MMSPELRTALIRFSSQFGGIANELPANIRRGPILDADEAEERSVSADQLDKGLPSASRESHCRGPLNPERESAAPLEFGMVSPEQLGIVSPEPPPREIGCQAKNPKQRLT